MAKKIVRITESDLVKIVKRLINEQGGYDDQFVMATHSGSLLGGLNNIIDKVIDMLDQATSALTNDISKTNLMSGVNKITDILDMVEDQLRKINPEVMLNRDLRSSVSELKREIRKGKDRLRTLTSFNKHFISPKMKGGLTGIGMSMSDKELNDKLASILLKISSSAEKLAFQVKDETNNMYRRMDRLN